MHIYEKSYKLNFTQCYPNGQLKYSELNNILQLTASEHAEVLGFGYKAMLKVKQSWVLSRMRMEITKLPKYTDEVTVKTWIQEFTGSRSTRNFELSFQGNVIIAATSLWVVFNMEKRKADILAVSTDHMEFFPDKFSTIVGVSKIDGEQSFQVLGDYKVKLSDLDIVNHANNVKYMDWCFDAMNPETILDSSIKTLEMNFLKELKYADKVQILTKEDHSGEQTLAIQKNEKTHFLMKLSR